MAGKRFYLRMFSDVYNIKRLCCFFLFFLTGKDQAYSADSDGEGTQGAANFGGRESDPAASLIKQNIPG